MLGVYWTESKGWSCSSCSSLEWDNNIGVRIVYHQYNFLNWLRGWSHHGEDVSKRPRYDWSSLFSGVGRIFWFQCFSVQSLSWITTSWMKSTCPHNEADCLQVNQISKLSQFLTNPYSTSLVLVIGCRLCRDKEGLLFSICIKKSNTSEMVTVFCEIWTPMPILPYHSFLLNRS